MGHCMWIVYVGLLFLGGAWGDEEPPHRMMHVGVDFYNPVLCILDGYSCGSEDDSLYPYTNEELWEQVCVFDNYEDPRSRCACVPGRLRDFLGRRGTVLLPRGSLDCHYWVYPPKPDMLARKESGDTAYRENLKKAEDVYQVVHVAPSVNWFDLFRPPPPPEPGSLFGMFNYPLYQLRVFWLMMILFVIGAALLKSGSIFGGYCAMLFFALDVCLLLQGWP